MSDTVARGVLHGILLLLVLGALAAGVLTGLAVVPSWFGPDLELFLLIAAFQMPMAQILVLLPVAWLRRRRGHAARAKGITIVSGVAFLLGGLCNAVVFTA